MNKHSIKSNIMISKITPINLDVNSFLIMKFPLSCTSSYKGGNFIFLDDNLSSVQIDSVYKWKEAFSMFLYP